MNMQMDTESRKAFELVTEAILDINEYKSRRELGPIYNAKRKLEEALKEDPTYLRAHYFAALMDDLIGKPQEAVERLKQIHQTATSPFKEEVQYNLGVAYYHLYSHENLDRAIESFREVIERATDEGLRLRARAGLAQAYAMRMIPRLPEEANLEDMERQRALAEEQHNSVTRALMNRIQVDPETRAELEWIVRNARALALMYSTDYLGSTGEKIRDLGQALAELAHAEKWSPRNFAIYCNFASVHMRLGYWKQNAGSKRSDPKWDFDRALERLTQVVNDVKSGYGFALYEMGRTYRLMGNFEEALKYYRKALEVPYPDRNVSDRRVNREIHLAEEKSLRYP